MESVKELSPRVSLLRKLHAVMKDVDYIQKDKRNDFHRYNYASEAAIKEHLQKALVTHGLVFYTDHGDLTERPVFTGKERKEEVVTTLRVIYHFADIDTGEEITGSGLGCGNDPLDKGVYKAITGAIKYILTSTFLIPTGDDPEQEPKPTKEDGKAAAKAVGEEKIRKMQSERAAGTADDNAVAASPEFKQVMEGFAAIKAEFLKAGQPDEYYRILGSHGFEKSNLIRPLSKARPIYKEMATRLKEIRAEMELGV